MAWTVAVHATFNPAVAVRRRLGVQHIKTDTVQARARHGGCTVAFKSLQLERDLIEMRSSQ